MNVGRAMNDTNRFLLEKPYLTTKDVASYLMVSVAAVRRWAVSGDLKARTTPGGHRRFLSGDVMAFAQQKGITPPAVVAHNKKLKVLIVEDDIEFSVYLAELLSSYSDRVETCLASTGFEAGSKVHEFKPNIILLDLKLPGLNGFQVCADLKSRPECADLRIISMTGYATASNVERVIKAGAEACLEKPINTNDLFALLNIESETEY